MPAKRESPPSTLTHAFCGGRFVPSYEAAHTDAQSHVVAYREEIAPVSDSCVSSMNLVGTTIMDLYAYLFGGVCIVVYAWSRFNTPATWRSTTTSWRYWLALSGYVVAALGLWFVLARLVSTNPQIVQFLASGSPTAGGNDVDQAIATLSGLSAPLLAALFLTSLLPRLPLLARLDTALQRAFREIGAIPHKARQLSTMMRRAPFAVGIEDRSEVKRRLEAQGLDGERLLQSPAGSLPANWVQIVALMAKLDEAVDLTEGAASDDASEDRASTARSDFVRHREVEYLAVRAAYRQQAAIASVLLKSGLQTGDERLAQEVLSRAESPDLGMRGLQQSFEDGCRRLLKEITHLISCGVLQANFSMAAACRELRSWGFGDFPPNPRGISVNDLIGIMLTITLYLFVLFMFVHGRSGMMTKAPALAVSVGLTMTAAVACAIYCKRLPIAGAAGRNFAVYLLAGVLAAACWFAIHYVRIMLMNGEGFEAVLSRLGRLSPIAFVPFAAAFVLAWMTDISAQRWRIGASVLRWLEGMVLACVLAGAAYVAFTYAAELRQSLPPDLQRGPGPVIQTVVYIQAGLGFLIGAMVPHLYRRAMSEATAEEKRGQVAALPTAEPLLKGAG